LPGGVNAGGLFPRIASRRPNQSAHGRHRSRRQPIEKHHRRDSTLVAVPRPVQRGPTRTRPGPAGGNPQAGDRAASGPNSFIGALGGAPLERVPNASPDPLDPRPVTLARLTGGAQCPDDLPIATPVTYTPQFLRPHDLHHSTQFIRRSRLLLHVALVGRPEEVGSDGIRNAAICTAAVFDVEVAHDIQVVSPSTFHPHLA